MYRFLKKRTPSSVGDPERVAYEARFLHFPEVYKGFLSIEYGSVEVGHVFAY